MTDHSHEISVGDPGFHNELLHGQADHKKHSNHGHAAPGSSVKFGTDGWRGVIADDFTFENVHFAASATAKTFEDPRKTPKVFVGYDHRFFAEKFAQKVVQVLAKYKFKPLLTPHAVTSPLLSYMTWKNKSPFGVMLTASHNPATYLGFKVKGSFGGSISPDTVALIEKNLENVAPSAGASSLPIEIRKDEKKKFHLGLGDQIGVAESPIDDYLKYIKSNLDLSIFRKGKCKIVFDSMHGPGGFITERFFKSPLGKIKPLVIRGDRDPLFGGVNPEPIEENLQALKDAIKAHKAEAGFALDGDADRLGVIDEHGQYLTPQQVFALFTWYLAAQKKLPGKVVQAVSLGYLSERVAKDHNLPFEEVPVGFKYVAERLLREELVAGGEESGGYAFTRTVAGAKKGALLPERDGLVCALVFTEMMIATGKTVSQLLKDLQKKYGSSVYLRKDIRLAKPIKDKAQFTKQVQNHFPDKWLGMKVKEMRTGDGLKIIFEDGSWTLMRPSGTEPLLRTYAEFAEKSVTESSLAKLSQLLGTLKL